jgi:O-antigen/teichoic acid export membrane protein
MVWSSIGRFGTLAVTLVITALVARLLTPDDFGSYLLLVSSAATVALFAQAALPQTAVRSVAAAVVDERGNRARGAIGRVVRMTVVTALVALAVVASPARDLLQVAFPTVPFDAAFAGFVGIVAARLFENVWPEIFRGLKDFRNAAIFAGLASGAVLALLLVLLQLRDSRPTLNEILLVTALASGVALALASLLLWRRVRRLPRTTGERRFDFSLIDVTLWGGIALNFVVTQMDLWVVGALASPEDLALYGAAYRLSMVVQVPATIAQFVVPPLVVQLLAQRRKAQLQSVVQSVATVASVPSLAIVAFFALAGPLVCALVYGSFYADAGIVLAVLALGKAANVLTGACGVTLIMAGGRRQNLVAMIVTFVVTLPLQVLGFHLFGILGVAAATALGVLLQNVLLVIAVRRLVGISTLVAPIRTARLLRRELRRQSPAALVRSVLRRPSAPAEERRPSESVADPP